MKLDAVANVPPTLELRSWRDGQRIWSHPIGEWYRREVGAPYLTLHRATLQRLLAEAVPSDQIELGRKLIGLSDEREGVRLHFEDREDVVARVVVASTVCSPSCDGSCAAMSGPASRARSGYAA